MSLAGQRKAALYLSSLAVSEQRTLLAGLPAATACALRPLIAQVVAHGWNDPELVNEVLAEELRGLTARTALSVETLLAFSQQMPADWTARVFAANSGLDSRFMVALLDGPQARRVEQGMQDVPRLPPKLREALLDEVGARALAKA
jgi:hypothetical protein